MKLKLTTAIFSLWAEVALAAPLNQTPDFAKIFAVDLGSPLPSFAELKQSYVKNNIYDRKYDFSWNIGHKFDDVFAQTIVLYGGTDKRLKPEAEDMLMATIEALPPETYPYIGPYLHTVPNMPEKILNLPGIKETKNQFPQRIAPQLQDIPDLEFLSPHLYYLLMPEVWPDYDAGIEQVGIAPRPSPKLQYNQKFFDFIKQVVPPQDFYPHRQKASPLEDNLRTLYPSADSPLTAADVGAFISTLDKVETFASQDNRRLQLVQAGMLINAYEADNNQALPFNTLKDLVNPCQRLAQRIRVLGLENEFIQIIGPDGFSLDEWAITCDRVVKAYRVSRMHSSAITSIKHYQRGVYNQEMMSLPDYTKGGQLGAMFSVIAMYQAPLPDVLAVRKHRSQLEQALKKSDYSIAGAPIAVNP